MVDNGSVPKQPLPHLGFVASNLTICVTVIRLILILGLLPNEIRPFLDLPAVRSATVRVRDTRRFLQVAAAFRNLFPTFQEAYSASTSPVSPLVLAVYLSVEHAWAPLPEYWRQVLWGIGLLVIDFLVAKTMEQIASCCMMQGDKERREERLQDKMPDAIRPSRGHLFQITSTVDQNGAKPLLVWKDIPLLAAQLYYASPMTCIGSGLFGSFQNLYCLLFLWSLHEMMMFKAGRPRVALASLALALAAYGQPWFISFSIPIVISQPTIKSARRFVALLVLWALWLQVLSYLLVGTDAYWTWKPTRSLTPNLGPTWYFQMQLFDRFQHYFALMFTGLPYVLLIPLTIRLYRYPIELVSEDTTIRATKNIRHVSNPSYLFSYRSLVSGSLGPFFTRTQRCTISTLAFASCYYRLDLLPE